LDEPHPLFAEAIIACTFVEAFLGTSVPDRFYTTNVDAVIGTRSPKRLEHDPIAEVIDELPYQVLEPVRLEVFEMKLVYGPAQLWPHNTILVLAVNESAVRQSRSAIAGCSS
jgi:hypothetical protein